MLRNVKAWNWAEVRKGQKTKMGSDLITITLEEKDSCAIFQNNLFAEKQATVNFYCSNIKTIMLVQYLCGMNEKKSDPTEWFL